MKIIGLTGPTGAGKSTAARWFADRGCAVIDCDAVAREIVQVGSPVLAQLAEAFSPAVLRPDGSLDRAALAHIAFADADTTARLNAITHPAILTRVRNDIEQACAEGYRAAVIDAPLLYESGFDAACDAVVAVLADCRVRRMRIMERDGIDEAAAVRRMGAQPEDGFYLGRGAAAVYNNGDTAALHAALQQAVGRWIDETPD